MSFSHRIIALVGLMGAGKTRVGMELSKLLDLPFVDADREIEAAAGMSVADIFEKFGETEFRTGEKKVILRLLSGEPKVIATGGGAFIQNDIRAVIKEKAVSVWLKAGIETLTRRVTRSDRRPLLRGVDPAEKLQEILDVRAPFYAEADIEIATDGLTPKDVARRIKAELEIRARP